MEKILKKIIGTRYQSLTKLQIVFRKFHFLVWPFESVNCGEKMKKKTNIENFRNEKSFLEEKQLFFII